MAFSLSRNAKLYVSTGATIADMTVSNTWEIPVLDGFAFTAATATQEIEFNEAGSTPVRGQQVFTTAIEPVNWNLTNYMRPRYDSTSTVVDAVERIFWEALAAKPDANTVGTKTNGLATTRQAGSGGGLLIDFDQSRSNTLLELSLVFNLGDSNSAQWYHIEGAVVDQVEIDFSIDAIATTAWSGYGTRITQVSSTADLASLASMLANPQGYDGTFNSSPGYLTQPTQSLGGCIRNKLSTVSLVGNSNYVYGGTYDLALTGGSLTISNNITFLTPESLGVVNQPCGHFTGQLTVSGNMTAYLKSNTGQTADLMANLLAYANSGVATPTDFDLTLYIGGAPSAIGTPWATPVIQMTMAHTHIVIPQINIEDVVAVDIPFNALGDTAGTVDPEATNQLVVNYYADQS